VCKPCTGAAASRETVRMTGDSEGAAVRVSHNTASADSVPVLRTERVGESLARSFSVCIKLRSGAEPPLDVSRPLVEPLWINAPDRLTYEAPVTDCSFSLQKRLICWRPGAWPMHYLCVQRGGDIACSEGRYESAE
jgi:hypothetical protein